MDYFKSKKSFGSFPATLCCGILFFMLVLPSLTEAFNYPSAGPDDDPYNSRKWEIQYQTGDGGAQCSKVGSIKLPEEYSQKWFGHIFDIPIHPDTEIIFNFDFYCEDIYGRFNRPTVGCVQ